MPFDPADQPAYYTTSEVYTKAQVDALFAVQASQIASLATRVTALEHTTPPPVDPPPVDPPPVTGLPFKATSNWNTKLPATGVTYQPIAGFTGGGWCNRDSYSSPLIRAKSTDPLVTITPAGPSWGWPGAPFSLRIPANVTGSPGTDGSLIVVDGTTEYDFWQFRRTSASTATCQSYAKADTVNGNGWGIGQQGAGIHASGSSLWAGFITGNELTAGINHAVAMACRINLVNQSLANGAIASDGQGQPLPMGARLAIPRTQAPPTGMSTQGKVLWKAFQEYGSFVVDTTGYDPHAFILSADPLSVPAADVDALLGPSWTAFDLAQIGAAARRVS